MKSNQNPLIRFIIVNDPDLLLSADVKDGDYMCPRCHHRSRIEICPHCGSKCNRIMR